jgi:tetratricopeptide (TPR) repeat protein
MTLKISNEESAYLIILNQFISNYNFNPKYFEEAGNLASLNHFKPSKNQNLINTKRKKQVDTFLERAKNELSGEKYIELLSHWGKLLTGRKQFQLSIHIFKEIIGIAGSEEKYGAFLPDTYLSLAASVFLNGDLSNGKKYAEKSLNSFLSLNDNTGCAKSENILAAICSEKGMFDAAKRHLTNSAFYLNDSHDYYFKGKLEINIGILFHLEENHQAAIISFRRAINYLELIDDHALISEARYNLGVSLMKASQFEAAASEFNLSIKSGLKSGNQTATASSFLAKSLLSAKHGDKILSRIFKEKAFKIFYKNNNGSASATDSRHLAKININDQFSSNIFAENFIFPKTISPNLNEDFSFLNHEISENQNDRECICPRRFMEFYGSPLYLRLDSHLLNFQYR